MQRNPSLNTAKSRDMTTGSAVSKLIRFSVPVLIGSIFTQLYNVVDSIVVGQNIGAEALAAVGASFPLTMMCNAIFIGLGNGASVLVSQYFGAGKKEELSEMVGTTSALSFLIGLLLTFVGMLVIRPILLFLHTPANILDDAATYMRIIFFGTLGNLFYNNGAAILRGLGDSKWPMLFLILCAAINIALDLLFVLVFHLGVAGVGYATIIAQLISAILVTCRLLWGGYGIHLSALGLLHPDKRKCGMLARIGIPSAISMLIASLGIIVIQRYNNGFGSDFLAAMAIMMKVDGFALIPLQALGMAATTFVGQNLGAGRDDRVKEGVRATLLIIVIIGLGLGIVMALFGYQLGGLFTKDPAVKEICRIGMRIVFIMYAGMGLQQALNGIMRGAGAVTIPMLISLLTVIIRVPAAYLLAVVPNDYRGIFYSMIIFAYIGALLLFLYYRFGNWKTHVAIRDNTAQGADLSATFHRS